MKKILLLTFLIPTLAFAVNITVPQANNWGDVLRGNANGTYTPVATSTLGISGSGTVSSVAMTVPTGFSISGSPITTTGTLGLTFTAGYGLPLTASTTNWNSFYDTPSTRISDGLGLTWSGNTLDCDTASGSVFGCLTSTDWNTFNNKLGSYDGWTHPATGVSATTSTLYLSNGFLATASSTITGNVDGANALHIRASASSSPSISAGGLLHINMNTFGGTGLEVVGNRSTGSNGRLVNFIQNGTGDVQDMILASSSGSNVTAFNIKGFPTGKGILKIEHTGGGTGFANASGLSIDLLNATDAQGIFVKGASSGTGKLLNFVDSGSATLGYFDSNGLFNSKYSTSTIYSSFNTSSSTTGYFGTAYIPSLGIPAGTLIAVDPNGKIIATTTSAGGVTSVTGTYPVISSGGSTPAISLAFGTTTSNTWAGTQAFTNTANFNTFTNNGSATTTNLAITALTGVLVGNGSTKPLSVAVSGTDFKTINGNSILGSGDLTITGSGSGLASSTPWTFGSLVVAKDNGSVTTISTSTIKTSQLTNDAGFSSFPFTVNTGYNSTTTALGFLGGFFSTASSTASDLKVTGTLQIPNNTAPSMGSAGQIGLDTTSNDLIFATSTTGNIIIQSATSTLFGLNGTTTAITSGLVQKRPPFSRQTVVTDVGCAVTSGTLQLYISDGTNNSNTVTCTTTYTNYAFTSNNVFTAGTNVQVVWGTKTGDTGDIISSFNGYQISN